MKLHPVVLAVDDEANNLRLLSQMLESLDYEVRASRSGKLALEMARTEPPDIILLDIEMPEMSGFEVCEKIVNTPSLAEIPVIFLSGHVDTEQKILAFRAGGRDYIEKPFNVEEVAARLSVHIDLARSKILERERSTFLEATVRENIEAASLRERLTAMLVHDLRAPLQIVVSVLETIDTLNTDIESKELGKLCERGMGAFDTLLTFVDGFLDVDRIKTGNLPAVLAPTHLQYVFEQSRSALGAPKNLVGINLDHFVMADSTLLLRVLVNLCGNSLKYAGSTKPIEVSCDIQPNGMIDIHVKDEGVGIAPEDLERIFDIYFGQGTSNSGMETPSGVGLAFCKAAVEAQEGTISVRSVPNRGSTFTISLARAKKPSASSM